MMNREQKTAVELTMKTRLIAHRYILSYSSVLKTHSPIKPLEAEWRDASSTVSERGGPISDRTLL